MRSEGKPGAKKRKRSYKAEAESLRIELEEALETLQAIRGGEIDALVVAGPKGERVFTLQGADQPYRILVETMSEGAVNLDAEGVIFYCNQRFAEMLRLPLERVIGSPIVRFIRPADREGFLRSFAEAAAGRAKRGVVLESEGGAPVVAHLSMSAVELETGSGVCLIATDLTDQQRFEQAKADLERLSLEKELRERFVSTLSHDLRNPLTAARAGAQMIVRYPERVDRLAAIGNRIIHSIDRADKMIRDLLDVNLIRAGERLPLQIEECDLSATARATLEELSIAVGDRFVLEGDPSVVGYWSCSQLTRVIENLATNAVKYGAPDAPVQVRLQKEKDSVRLAVHNQGPGLTQDEQANLFRPYLRTQSAQASGQKGWGLGLTLVRGVVEAHGGKVEVESAPQAGTTFTVILPADARPFQAESAQH